MKRAIFIIAALCLFALPALAQTTVTGTFLTPSGQTPLAAGLRVIQQVAGTDVCGQLDFVAYNANVLKPWAILWNGKTYFPQAVRGYIRCSDGDLIGPTGAAGLSIIPNTDAQPQGTLTWMSGGLSGSVDGTLRPTGWSEAKAIPDQTSVDWGTLPVAQIVNVGYQTIESQSVALNARPTVNFTGGMTCTDDLANNRTDCQPTSLTNPMTQLGQLLYGGTSGAPTALNGNTSSTREFLISQGSGGAATAPFLGALQASDIPSSITSNTTGNAATATALAAAPSACPSGEYATSVDVHGNAICGVVNFSQVAGTLTEGVLPSTTVFTDQNAVFGAHNYDFGAVSEFVIPKVGGDPGSPVAGQFWLNASALKFRDNGGTPATHQIEVQDEKGQANGYAGLDATTHIFAADIPAPTVSALGGVESLACSNQFLTGISTSGIPQCGSVSYSVITGVPVLPVNTPAVSNEFLTSYNSSTGAFSQAQVGYAQLSGIPNFYYQTVDNAGTPLTQRGVINFSGAGITCVDNAGAGRTDCTVTSGGGGSLTLETNTASNPTQTVLNFLNNGPFNWTAVSGGNELLAFANQNANLVLVGPCSGAPATPTFRALCGADLPNPSSTTLGGIESLNATAHEWINSVSTSGVPAASQPGFSDISGTLAASQLPTPTLSALGGIEAVAGVSHEFVSSIDTSGVPHLTQPAYSDLTGAPSLFYQTLDSNGTAQTQQPTLNLISGSNATVVCANNVGASRTDCTVSASSSAGARIDQISSAAAANTINNAAFSQVWNWALTGAQTGMTFGENAASTGSGNILLRATTLSGSTALPFQADSNGNGVQVSATGKLTAVGTGSIDATALAGLVPAASLPNPTASTLGGVESIAAASHEWLTSISTSGVPAQSQPGFADISGTIAAAQLPAPTLSALGGIEAINSVSHEWISSIDTSGIPHLTQPGFADVSGTAIETQLPSTTVFTDKAATFGAFAYDFTSASLVIPNSAGAAPTASANVAYDTTANAFEGGVNGVKHTFAFLDSSITGNAATATSAAKWTTARLLAGNSVDGSVNVAFANKFIVQGTTDSGLSGAQFLGALGSGILYNTTSTGVLSIATAAQVNTTIQSLTGCNTASYVYTPQGSDCVASVGLPTLPTSPNGIPQIPTSIPSGGVGGAVAWSVPGVPIDAQTGTSYPVPITDDAHFLTVNNASPVAITGFALANNYTFAGENLGAGLATYTPASGTVNGAASQIIPKNWMFFHYTDNSNTFMPVMPTLGAFADCNGSGKAETFTAASGTFGCNTISGGGYATIDSNGSAVTQRATVNFIPGAGGTVSCVDNAGATRTDCTFGSTGGAGGQIDYSVSYQTHVESLGLSLIGSTTVANTGAATSLLSSFEGRQDIPAGAMVPNAAGAKTIKIHASGVLGTASSAPTLTFAILLGGQTLSTITVPVTASLSSTGWSLDYYFTVDSLTSAQVGGCVDFIGTAGAVIGGCASSASVTGLNFATKQNVDVQVTWGTASASNTLTANQLTVHAAQSL